MEKDYKFQKEVEETLAFLKKTLASSPKVLITTGTGQCELPVDLNVEQVIPYASIPNFLKTTAPGHKGRLVIGNIAGQDVAVLQGRLHYYEGYSIREITLPVRVLSQMGAEILLAGNTAGGLNPQFSPGDLMIIDDHLNFLGGNPLRGPNHDDWGLRFPDMSNIYSPRLREKVQTIAARKNIRVKNGVYVAVAGPSLETPAETKFLRMCGADAVGMSTVPEIIVARHAGMEVFGLAIIANVNIPDNFKPIILEEVIAQVEHAEHIFLSLIDELLLHL